MKIEVFGKSHTAIVGYAKGKDGKSRPVRKTLTAGETYEGTQKEVDAFGDRLRAVVEPEQKPKRQAKKQDDQKGSE